MNFNTCPILVVVAAELISFQALRAGSSTKLAMQFDNPAENHCDMK
jgi:hypothetical protein